MTTQSLKETIEELLDSIGTAAGVAFVDCEVGSNAYPSNPRDIKSAHKELSEEGIKLKHIADWGDTNFEECASIYKFSSVGEEVHVMFLGNYHDEEGTEYLGWQFAKADPKADNGWSSES